MLGIDRIVSHWSFSDAFETRDVVARSSSGLIYRKRVWCGMPIIPPPILNSCFYLYHDKHDAKVGRPSGGTGFIVGIPAKADERMFHTFGVTNWHVAVRGGCSTIRVNLHSGGVDIIERDSSEWIFKPKWHDLAVIPMDLTDAHDITLIHRDYLIRRDEVAGMILGPGDDVFMVGRFIDHDGRTRNMPAARFGNISVMPTLGIEQPTGATLESYVLDVHSRTGYSGSPVFVYRTIGQNLSGGVVVSGAPPHQFVRFLGIHWGQFPEKWSVTPTGKVKPSSAKAKTQRRFIGHAEIDGLSGMTCAVPSWALLELMEDQRVRDIVESGEAELRRRQAQAGVNPKGEVA